MKQDYKVYLSRHDEFTLNFFSDLLKSSIIGDIFIKTTVRPNEPNNCTPKNYFETFQPFQEDLNTFAYDEDKLKICQEFLQNAIQRRRTFDDVLTAMVENVYSVENKIKLEKGSNKCKRKMPIEIEKGKKMLKDNSNKNSGRKIKNNAGFNLLTKYKIPLNKNVKKEEFSTFEEKLYPSQSDAQFEEFSLVEAFERVINFVDFDDRNSFKVLTEMIELTLKHHKEYKGNEEELLSLIYSLSLDFETLFEYLQNKESNSFLPWSSLEDEIILNRGSLNLLIQNKGRDSVLRRIQYLGFNLNEFFSIL
jgi:hypothetical protein